MGSYVEHMWIFFLEWLQLFTGTTFLKFDWFSVYAHLKIYMNETSNIGNFQWIILVEAYHVQAKTKSCNVQIGIWPLQFGEFFGGLGSCQQMLDGIPSDIFSLW